MWLSKKRGMAPIISARKGVPIIVLNIKGVGMLLLFCGCGSSINIIS